MKNPFSNTYCIVMLAFCLFSQFKATYAQKNVGIGTTTPHSSAILELSSAISGFLTPRLDSTQMISIASPANGLIIFNTSDNCFWYYKSSLWTSLCQTATQSDSTVLTIARIDSLYSKVAYIDSLYSQVARIDTLFSSVAQIDSLISSYISTTTINSKTGYFDSLYARVGNFDTLLIKGKSIDSLISGTIDSTAWKLKGNTGTSSTTNFIGTSDAQDLVFKTNGIEAERIDATGNIGIGTNTPTKKLDVEGGLRFRTGATKNYVLTSDSIGNATWQDPKAIFKGGAISSFEVIWSGSTNTNNQTLFLIVGKKFSDYDEIMFLTITGNYGFIPVPMFTTIKGITSNRGVNDLWTFEVFSGDDSGQIGIAHISTRPLG